MICQFPFTYLKEHDLQALLHLDEQILVCLPPGLALPESVRKHSEGGGLVLQYPDGLDASHLHQVIGEFKAWSDLHQGDIKDLARFSKVSQGKTPLVSDTDPTQIGTQIRRLQRAEPAGRQDFLLQACLFLSLAHEFDVGQEALQSDLRGIQDLEQRMYERLLGDADEVDELGLRMPRPDGAVSPAIQGDFMTEQRLQAWATVAGHLKVPAWAWFTTSRSVFESLRERFADALMLLRYQLPSTPEGRLLSDEQQAYMRSLAVTEKLTALSESDPGDEIGRGGLRLSLMGIPDCPPVSVLARILKRERSALPANEIPDIRHTLIGLIDSEQLRCENG